MASKIEALIRNFLRTDGEALCLVPGERIYLLRGGAKSIVGREILSEDSFRVVAEEVAPGEPASLLADRRHRVPYRIDDASEPLEIEFGWSGASHILRILRTRSPVAAAPEGPSLESVSAIPIARAPAPPPPDARRSGPDAVPLPGQTRPARTPDSTTATRSPRREDSRTAEPAGSRPAAPAAAGSPAAQRPLTVGGETSPAISASAHGAARVIDGILMRMLELKASDVHFAAGAAPYFRIHGEMVAQNDFGEMTSHDIERLVEPVLPERNRRQFEERNDTDCAHEIEGVSRFRVNVFRDRKGVGAVLRQIPIEILSAQQLSLPPVVTAFGDLSKGLVLVTGPTGSGKSTTLAAIIDHINANRTDHIITIEDPIEFVHPNKKCLVNQREVSSHTHSFKDALRAALREDPDIVLVGEMRDLETISLAIETAETGHLVFGTLHTTTAASTISRIVDQFPADRQAQIRVMLADSLKGVVAQTLCKKIGGGRVAALEILLVNAAVSNLIRDGKTFQIPSVMQTSKNLGMVQLNDSLVELVRRGLVEPREAYLKSVDKLSLLQLFESHDIPSPIEAKHEAHAGPAVSPAPTGPAPVGAGRRS